MEWAGHVARMRGEKCIPTKFRPENLEGRDHLEYTNVAGGIILKLI
jgi:hypothetical protein